MGGCGQGAPKPQVLPFQCKPYGMVEPWSRRREPSLLLGLCSLRVSWAGVSAPRPQSPFPAKPCSPIKPRTQSYPGALAGLGTSSCSWDAPRAACPSRGVGFPLAFSEPAHVGAGLQNLCEGRKGRGDAGRGEAGRALGLAPWALRRSTCCPVLPSRTKAPTEHAAREFRGEGGPSHVPVACGPLCSLTPDAAAVRGTSRPQHPKVHGGPAL